MSKILHARKQLSGNNEVYSGTACGHVMLTEQTVANPRDATCKKCLNIAISKQGKLELCKDCNDNFYNGNNQIGVKECWCLEKAQVVHQKKVGINDVPPWKDQPIVTILSCRYEKGFVFVGADQEY